jgi:hypothetical protein
MAEIALPLKLYALKLCVGSSIVCIRVRCFARASKMQRPFPLEVRPVAESLGLYLQDHLAGAAYGVMLLETMRDQRTNEPLSRFAAELLVEIEADREVLRRLADHVGVGESSLKGLAAWIADKLGRPKLGHNPADPLGTFEALEFLELGIHGKWALWRALDAAAADDARLQGIDFEHLVARAEAQRTAVEQRRLEAAREALKSAA